MPDTLKPCPECGGKMQRHYNDSHAGPDWDECEKCGWWASTANAAWNRRAPSPEVERLVALQREAENKRRALESLKKENKALKEKLAPITHRDRDFKELKNEIENLREMVKDSAKHLAYALDYGPEDAIDNTLHAGCRDRALAHLRTLVAYKEAQR